MRPWPHARRMARRPMPRASAAWPVFIDSNCGATSASVASALPQTEVAAEVVEVRQRFAQCVRAMRTASRWGSSPRCATRSVARSVALRSHAATAGGTTTHGPLCRYAPAGRRSGAGSPVMRWRPMSSRTPAASDVVAAGVSVRPGTHCACMGVCPVCVPYVGRGRTHRGVSGTHRGRTGTHGRTG